MKILKASVLSLMVASPAFAGGLTAPVMEEPVMAPAAIEDDTAAGSRAGIIVPLFALLMFALGSSGGGGNQAAQLPPPG